jgi:tetratricopeptide (TPR) repeat protein
MYMALSQGQAGAFFDAHPEYVRRDVAEAAQQDVVRAASLGRAHVAFLAAWAAAEIYLNLGDRPRALINWLDALQETVALSEAEVGYDDVREQALELHQIAREISSQQGIFRSLVLAADCSWFTAEAAFPDLPARERLLMRTLKDVLMALRAVRPVVAGPDDGIWVERLASLLAVSADAAMSQTWYDVNRGRGRLLRQVAAAADVLPVNLRFASEGPRKALAVAAVLEELESQYHGTTGGRAAARLQAAMTTAAASGVNAAWLAGTQALKSALRRADRAGPLRPDLWVAVAAAWDRVRLGARSREGRLTQAEDADELVGSLLRDVLDEHTDVAAAFTLTEAARSRVLLDTLAGAFRGGSGDPREAELAGRAMAFTPDDDSPVRELMVVSAVRHMPIEDPDLQSARAAALEALEALYADGSRGFEGGAGTAPLAEVQAALGARQVLVEYVIPYHPIHPAYSLVALVVTADAATVVPLTVPSLGVEPTRLAADGMRPLDTSPLGYMVATARAAIQSDDMIAARAWGRFLHRMLVGPVLASGAASGRDEWIVVPHRQLHPCPWMALIDAEGLPWLANTTVTICPSASVWLHLARSPRAGHAALALGNPLLGYAGLPALPAAGDEIEHLRVVWQQQGWPVDARTGARATAAALEAGAAAANVVHLATHGSFPAADAGAAHGLFLGLAARSPGPLPLPRIRALDLRQAWCTTLSICDGGLYLVGPGDELLGMVAAVLEAGSSTVLAAQWKVDDDAGHRFMRHAVTALATAGPARALRAGALALAAEGAPPKYWAAFIAIGNGNGPQDDRELASEQPAEVRRFLRDRRDTYGPGGAALDLARLLGGHRDTAGAQSAYQSAIASGHHDHAATAAMELGVLLNEAGDMPGARAAFRRAADSGHPVHAAAAAVNLGLLLARHGDSSGARASYQRAIDTGHPEHAPTAACHLGDLLRDHGDLAGARSAYQLAADSQHPGCMPAAARSLGLLLVKLGDAAAAETAFRRAVDSGHPEHAPGAAVSLGVLLAERGDIPSALAAFQIAVDSSDTDDAPLASAAQGYLLAAQGDVAAAVAAYQIAVDSGHQQWAPVAAQGLGELLDQHGDCAAARAAYQKARDLGYTEPTAPQTGSRPRRARWKWPWRGLPR